MSNLLKNEFIKVFKKKGFIVLLIIMFGFSLLTNIIYNNIDSILSYEDVSYIEENYKYAKEEYEKNKKNKDNLEWYLNSKTEYDEYQIKKDYGKDSWQYYYLDIEANLFSILNRINSYELGFTSDKVEYEQAKEELGNLKEKLKNDDWKDIIKSEKSKLEEEIKLIDDEILKRGTQQNIENNETENTEPNEIDIETEEDLSEGSLSTLSEEELKKLKKSKAIDLEVLDIQLEQEISWKEQFKYYQLQNYASSKKSLLLYEEKDIEKLNKEEKNAYYELREEYLINEHAVKNNEYATYNQISTIINEFYNEYTLMIIIFIFLISGPIVSQEFSKGTIKLLLVKPYSRTKLLFSKYIVSLSSIFIGIIIMFIFELIIGGIMFGFDSLSNKVVIYSSITDSAMYLSTLKYFLLNTISYLPQFIILTTLVFAASTIFNNTAISIITGFVGFIGTNILLELLQGISSNWIVKLFIGYNWNMSPYIFNQQPMIKGLTCSFSLLICLVYLLLLIIPTFVVFKNRDIKNV